MMRDLRVVLKQGGEESAHEWGHATRITLGANAPILRERLALEEERSG